MPSTSDGWWLRLFEPRARNSIAARYHAPIATTARTDLSGRPIALAGFMGAGKTTIVRLLAKRLARPFYDTDGYVEAATGRSVEDFFLKQQKPEFRQREADPFNNLLPKCAVLTAPSRTALL